MTKVGHLITDPKAGAYCQMTLDSGTKLIVNHDKGGFKGGHLSIEVTRFMGFSSDRIFTCDLDSPAGQTILARLTQGAPPGTTAATPLGALVGYVTTARSLDELKAKCDDLLRTAG
ncbi:MAG TPA: hypothetical protein VFQ62_23150 [Methylomirabilota bacterium]|nr:hypothetical protein [Methylomirabilota bacterium]